MYTAPHLEVGPAAVGVVAAALEDSALRRELVPRRRDGRLALRHRRLPRRDGLH